MNTNYFIDLVAGNLYGTKKSPAIPSKYYIGLSTTAPNAEGTNVTEPSSSAGYKRVELTNLSAPSKGKITNQNSISFDESTQPWGVITHFVIYDALSGGNLLCYGQLETPRTVETATIMTLKDGYLVLTVANLP